MICGECFAYACRQPAICRVRCLWRILDGIDFLARWRRGADRPPVPEPVVQARLCAGHENDLATGVLVRLSPAAATPTLLLEVVES